MAKDEIKQNSEQSLNMIFWMLESHIASWRKLVYLQPQDKIYTQDEVLDMLIDISRKIHDIRDSMSS